MSAVPPRPEDSVPGTAAELIEHLGRLRVWAGKPSYRKLEKLGGQRTTADGQPVTALPPTTTWEILSGRRLPQLPRLDFVQAFAGACLRAGGLPDQEVESELVRWRAAWQRIAGQPDERPAPAGADAGTGANAGAGANTGAGAGARGHGHPLGQPATTPHTPPSPPPGTDGASVPEGRPSLTPATEDDSLRPHQAPGGRHTHGPPRRRTTVAAAVAGLAVVGLVAGVVFARLGTGGPGNGAESASSTLGEAADADSGAGDELVVNSSFAATHEPWWGHRGVRLSANDGELRAEVEGGTPDPWDRPIGQSGIELNAQHSYLLSFDASGSAELTVQVRVQLAEEPYDATLVREVALAEKTQHFQFPFTSELQTPEGQVTIHLGGHDQDYTAWFDNVSLVEVDPG